MSFDSRKLSSNIDAAARSGLALIVWGVMTTSVALSEETQVQDEIIVTVQKREEPIQDVALSVTAFSGDEIDRLGLDEAVQLVDVTPNFTAQGLFGLNSQPILGIRGVTFIDIYGLNDPSVATVVDEVHQSSPSASLAHLFDIERVEILRGPQGTLFGRNTTGGLAHYITRRPSAERDGYVSVQGGSFGQFKLEGAVSGPFSDSVRGRLAFYSNSDDGWQENLTTRQRTGKTDVKALRGGLSIDVGQGGEFFVSAHYADSDSTAAMPGYFGNVDPQNPERICTDPEIAASLCDGGFLQGNFRDPDPQPDEVFSDILDPLNSSESYGAVAHFTYDLSTVKLTSVTGYESSDLQRDQDVDAGPINAWRAIYETGLDQFSQEIRLSGETQRMTWQAGAIWSSDNRIGGSDLILFGAPLPGSGPRLEVDTEAAAVFGQADYAINDKLTASLGLRYTDETRELKSLKDISQPDVDFGVQDKLTTSPLTWRAALEYKPYDDVLLYAQSSRSFKSGGYNATTDVNQIGPVGEETVDAIELGWKQSFSNTLRLSSAVFHYDFTDLQTLAGIVLADGSSEVRFLNAGNPTVIGGEMEVSWTPNSNWLINLGLGLLESEIEASPDVFIGSVPLDGRELPTSPSHNFTGLIRREFDLGRTGRLGLQADGYWTDEFFFGPDNRDIEKQEAFGILNLRAGWTSADDRFEVTALAENALDETYTVHKFSDPGPFFTSSFYVWGRSRTLGIQLKANLF